MNLYLGCAMPPFHPQHQKVMADLAPLDEWTFVDLYVEHLNIQKWDATKLDEVTDGSIDNIYASHLLEHIEHTRVKEVLMLWYKKLKPGGCLVLNVPNLVWAMQRVASYELYEELEGYYNEWYGDHGILSIVFGSQSHPGEYHKSGFTVRSLFKWLQDAGFPEPVVWSEEDAHDMGVVMARATK